ncbi:hypothetical protein GF362_04250 [Candidatus Dojkabacteria bacterium]|nr:hypothetical protein [Candidatus Dojkabacteria bacterium]
MNKIIDKNINNILLVTPDQLNPDSVASTIVLAQLLDKVGKDVTILTNLDKYQEVFEKNFPAEGLNMVNSVQSRRFYAKLPTDKEIEDIDIQKSENEFKLVITTKSGNLNKQAISFSRDKIKFDQILLLGFSQLENSNEFRQSFGESVITDETKLVHYYDSGVVTDSKYIIPSSSLSELVKMFSRQLNIPLSQEQATHLLTGIFFNTQNLKINANRQTVKNLYLLVNKDKADIDTANSRIYKKLTKKHVYWFNAVFQNLKVKDNFCFAYVDDENITSDVVGSLSNEDRIPIAKIKECDVAVVMVKLEDNIHGFMQVSSNKYSALELTKEFYRLGDKNYVYFWSKQRAGAIFEKFFKKMEMEPEGEIETQKETEQEKEVIKSEKEKIPAISKDRELPEEAEVVEKDTAIKETQQVETVVADKEQQSDEEKDVTEDDMKYVTKMIEPKVKEEEKETEEKITTKEDDEQEEKDTAKSKEEETKEEVVETVQQNKKTPQSKSSFVPSNYDPLPPAGGGE